MKTRIITAIVALIILVPVFIFSETIAFPIAIAFFSAVAVYEMANCMGLKKAVGLTAPLYLCAVGFPFVFRYITEIDVFQVFMFGFFLSLLYALAITVFTFGKYNIPNILALITVCFYIIGGISSIMLVRDSETGKYIWYLIFVASWSTDIFAYFVGKFFGRHKLIPEVSPKKTVEGAIGGVVFCVLFTVLYGFLIQKFTKVDSAAYVTLAIGGFLMSIVAQIGDLSMSAIKRHFGIKDYGKIFPGHGGVMDRLDSMIPVALILMMLTSVSTLFEV